MEYKITPVAKPRMTQRDKWMKRDVVVRYWEYKDLIKLNKVNVSGSWDHIIFWVPMPKSWPKKKKEEMETLPHKQKPDIDNYLKWLLDAIYDDDSHIWDLRTSKVRAKEWFLKIKKWK